MDQAVMIKASINKDFKGGITLMLDEDIPYEELRERIVARFIESAKFMGDAQIAVAFEGKKLTNEQQLDVLRIIEENTDVDVVCIMEDDAVKQRKYEKAINDKLMELSKSTGQFYKGNLRSGQTLEMETSVIIIGDINPGASIMSKGNIVVLGALKGTAFAGAAGNEKSFVLALDMSPVQIRIADTIARAPDKQSKDEPKETKIAFLENGNIYIEPLSKQLLNDIQI